MTGSPRGVIELQFTVGRTFHVLLERPQALLPFVAERFLRVSFVQRF